MLIKCNSPLDKGKYLDFLGAFLGSHDAGDSSNLGLARPNRCIGSASGKSPNTVRYVEETASQICSCKYIHQD